MRIARSMMITMLVLSTWSCGRKLSEGELKTTQLAQEYVLLALAMDVHDPGFVDAYYGPTEWRTEALENTPDLEEIISKAAALESRLAALTPSEDSLGRLRRSYIRQQLRALKYRARMAGGYRGSFNEESEALYGAVAPDLGVAHFDSLLAELEALLPGSGSVAGRIQKYQELISIPVERYEGVIEAALAETQRLTAQHMGLPDNENFATEYVTDKSWGAYNWYQGDYNSLIQINSDAERTMRRVRAISAHEAYPGHHTYHMQIELELVKKRGWPEYQVYPLYSPQGMVSEGSADYANHLIFSAEFGGKYERDVLFPMAGLEDVDYDTYAKILALWSRLDHADHIAARQYLDGEMSEEATIAWLMRYTLRDDFNARRRIKFFDKYRSYVVNYTLGEDLVANWITRQGRTDLTPAKKWQYLKELLVSPRLTNDLLQ